MKKKTPFGSVLPSYPSLSLSVFGIVEIWGYSSTINWKALDVWAYFTRTLWTSCCKVQHPEHSLEFGPDERTWRQSYTCKVKLEVTLVHIPWEPTHFRTRTPLWSLVTPLFILSFHMVYRSFFFFIHHATAKCLLLDLRLAQTPINHKAISVKWWHGARDTQTVRASGRPGSGCFSSQTAGWLTSSRTQPRLGLRLKRVKSSISAEC